MEADGMDEAARKAQRRDKILAEIDLFRTDYGNRMYQSLDREDAVEAARQAADVLPSAETLDKILRYETTLERQLYRAMNQLERLQRRRNGENIPAPLTMEIGAR